MNELKENIRRACMAALRQKISLIDTALGDLSASMESETKSSAGDKHETARARMQAERDQLSRQREEILGQLAALERIPVTGTAESVFTGSLVQTSQGFFFIAVALGKIKVDDEEVYVISPKSPMGQLLTGLQKHAEFSINEIRYRILNIY